MLWAPKEMGETLFRMVHIFSDDPVLHAQGSIGSKQYLIGPKDHVRACRDSDLGAEACPHKVARGPTRTRKLEGLNCSPFGAMSPLL